MFAVSYQKVYLTGEDANKIITEVAHTQTLINAKKARKSLKSITKNNPDKEYNTFAEYYVGHISISEV